MQPNQLLTLNRPHHFSVLDQLQSCIPPLTQSKITMVSMKSITFFVLVVATLLAACHAALVQPGTEMMHKSLTPHLKSSPPSKTVFSLLDGAHRMYKKVSLRTTRGESDCDGNKKPGSEASIHQASPGDTETCNSIAYFLGIAFDHAAALLSTGAGRDEDGMRAMQLVSHMRLVLQDVTRDVEDVTPNTKVCINTSVLVLQRRVTEFLMDEADRGELLVFSETNEKFENMLAEKRELVVSTLPADVLDWCNVIPQAGVDYPGEKVEAASSCLDIREYDPKFPESDLLRSSKVDPCVYNFDTCLAEKSGF